MKEQKREMVHWTDEATAWKCFKEGNPTALEYIFKRYNPILYHYGMHHYQDKGLVEDSIQDLFLLLWKNRTSLAEATSMKYYLIASLRRLILKRQKVMCNQRAAHDHVFLSQTICEESHEEKTIVQHDQQIKQQQLIQALDHLPLRQKQAIELKFLEEKSYADITDLMHINYQTARKFVYKALKSLRKHLPKGALSN